MDPIDFAAHAAAELTVKATLFRQMYGRDAAVQAGCVDSILALLETFGMGLTDAGIAELNLIILGQDETDDVLAGIMAASL